MEVVEEGYNHQKQNMLDAGRYLLHVSHWSAHVFQLSHSQTLHFVEPGDDKNRV